MNACPNCEWTWKREHCREGKGPDGRSYCFHAPCDNRWHDE